MNIKECDINFAQKEDFNKSLVKGGVMAVIPEDFSEVDIFCLLFNKIGEPNGCMSWSLGDGDPDALFKWDFIFSIPKMGIIHVLRSWKSIEIKSSNDKLSKKDLVDFISFNLNKHEDKIKEVKVNLENYALLINPYKRHENLAKNAKLDLDNVKVEKPIYPDRLIVESDEETRKYTDSFSKYIKSVEKETAYSITLCTHSAYMVEAYLNLIIAVLVKEEIKEVPRIFKETKKRKWENKLRRIHLDCVGVAKPDMDDLIIQKVRDKVFRLRNKVAHSYPDYKELKTSDMWFHKKFPILKNPEPFDTYQIASNNKMPSREQALNSFEIANEMIIFLKNIVDDANRDQFDFMAQSNPIGYNESLDRYCVPFSSEVSIGFLGGKRK